MAQTHFFLPSTFAFFMVVCGVSALKVQYLSLLTLPKFARSASPLMPFSYRVGSLGLCLSDSDCSSPRLCYSFDSLTADLYEACTGTEQCVCVSQGNLQCQSSADCLAGDRCATSDGVTLCYGCDANTVQDVTFIDEGNCSSGDTDDSTNSTSSTSPPDQNNTDTSSSDGGSGTTSFPCQTSAECISPRECYFIDEATISYRICQSGDGNCACFSDKHFTCVSSSDCLAGDICLQYTSGSFCTSCYVANAADGTPVDAGNCGDSDGSSTDSTNPTTPPSQSNSVSNPPSSNPSRQPVPSSVGNPTAGASPNNDGNNSNGGNICIAVDALEGYDMGSLVFKTHKRASVLCDQKENCATSGHMVIYKGEAMAMSTYCGIPGISCVRRVKLVNSPRMKMGLRVPSKSDDLKFTALAASKDTKIEKMVLRTLISLGA